MGPFVQLSQTEEGQSRRWGEQERRERAPPDEEQWEFDQWHAHQDDSYGMQGNAEQCRHNAWENSQSSQDTCKSARLVELHATHTAARSRRVQKVVHPGGEAVRAAWTL